MPRLLRWRRRSYARPAGGLARTFDYRDRGAAGMESAGMGSFDRVAAFAARAARAGAQQGPRDRRAFVCGSWIESRTRSRAGRMAGIARPATAPFHGR